MHKKDIQRYLKALKPEEYSDFKKYLESKYFKIENRERVVALYDYLIKKAAPAFEDELLNNDYLSKKLKFSNIRNLKTILANALEDFMFLEEVKVSHLESGTLKAKMLNNRNLNDEFKAYSSNWLSNLSIKKGISYNVALYKTIMLHHRYLNIVDKYSKNGYDTFEEFVNQIDVYYLNVKLYFEINNEVYKREFPNFNLDNYFIEKIIETVFDDKIENKPIVDLYGKLLVFEKKSNIDLRQNYFKCKEIFLSLLNEFSKRELGEILILLQNYCQYFINQGDKDFKIETFNWYKIFLEQRIYESYSSFHHILYYNIFVIAAELNELNWAENFISKYNYLLHIDYQKESFAVCSSYLEFCKGNFDVTLKLITESDIDDFTHLMTVKLLQIKCFYETQEFYLLENFLKTFKNFIRRNKIINQSQKERYLNFAGYVSKMAKLQKERDVHIIKFKQKIANDKNIPFRTWIEKKLLEL